MKGSYDLLGARLSFRKEYYMKPQMLQSQFEGLDDPANVLTVDGSMQVKDLVNEILKQLE